MRSGETYYRRHLPHYQPDGGTFHVVFRLAGSIPSVVLERFRNKSDQERRGILAGGDAARTALFRKHQWKYFQLIDQILAGQTRGPFWLRKPEVAAIVEEAIRFWDQKNYTLIVYSVMPNHVHMVFTLLQPDTLVLRRDGVPSDKICSPARLASMPGRRVSDSEFGRVRRVSDPTTENSEDQKKYRLTNLVGSIKKYSAFRANRVLGRSGPFWHPESYDHVIRGGVELWRTIWYVLNNPVVSGLCRDWRDWQWSYVKPGFVED